MTQRPGIGPYRVVDKEARINPATVPPEDRERVIFDACSRLHTEGPLINHTWGGWTRVAWSEDGCPIFVVLCLDDGCLAEQEYRHVDCPPRREA